MLSSILEKKISDFKKEDFTKKQLAIIELVGTGLSNDEIANKLLISKETVKSHLKLIYRKLDPYYRNLNSSTYRVQVAILWLTQFSRKN